MSSKASSSSSVSTSEIQTKEEYIFCGCEHMLMKCKSKHFFEGQYQNGKLGLLVNYARGEEHPVCGCFEKFFGTISKKPPIGQQIQLFSESNLRCERGQEQYESDKKEGKKLIKCGCTEIVLLEDNSDLTIPNRCSRCKVNHDRSIIKTENLLELETNTLNIELENNVKQVIVQLKQLEPSQNTATYDYQKTIIQFKEQPSKNIPRIVISTIRDCEFKFEDFQNDDYEKKVLFSEAAVINKLKWQFNFIDLESEDLHRNLINTFIEASVETANNDQNNNKIRIGSKYKQDYTIKKDGKIILIIEAKQTEGVNATKCLLSDGKVYHCVKVDFMQKKVYCGFCVDIYVKNDTNEGIVNENELSKLINVVMDYLNSDNQN